MKYLKIILFTLVLQYVNGQEIAAKSIVPSGELHTQWHSLLQHHVSNTGKVNYKGFLKDKALLKAYITTLQSQTPQANWPKQKVLAYWINAYNALTVDLILRNYPITSIKHIKQPWHQKLWQFNGVAMNLDTIEHNILRPMEEPRIHFAIVCASVSCPKLQNAAYTAHNLDKQLINATKAFLADSTKNKLTKTSIEISKLFKWFAKDFKLNGSSVIKFINQYSSITIAHNAKIRYTYYSWKLND